MDRERFEHWLLQHRTRRSLLGGFGSAIAAISLAGRPTRARLQESTASATAGIDPFSLGVASGDPLPTSIVLWTRLAPDPLAGGGMPPEPVEVRWEVAEDDQFRRLHSHGRATATVDLAHSVHVDVSGLQPGTNYFYRFLSGDAVSPIGRTRTAPAVGEAPERLRFGVCSCANWEMGFFPAYRDLATQEIDFISCLGDYFYEYGANDDYSTSSDPPPRLHNGPETRTLTEYRNRLALYRTDPDLQAAHHATPWIVTWDDHEVENNYAGPFSASGEPVETFLERRAAAYQAYYEHMPVRPESMPVGPDMRLYRRLTFGTLIDMHVLDTRQYRSDQPCGDTVGPRCEAALDPAIGLLGSEQESWLLDGLVQSGAQWNVLAQQVMMGELAVRVLSDEPQFSDDQWDGYPLARNRLLGAVRDARLQNVVVLTGDVHSAWVHDLKADFGDPASPVVATEFITTSISAVNPVGSALRLLLPGNPHIRYLDLRHGYTLCDVTPRQWTARFRAVESVADPAAPAATVATFVVEAGKPGATQID